MLINKTKIKKIGMFDKNIFLYYEEVDLYKRIKLANQKVYIIKDAKVTHLAAKSANIGYEFDKCRNWHFMWSQVYFAKKYSNNLLVYIRYLSFLFIQLFKFFYYILLFNKKEIVNKKMKFSGTLNS